MKDMNTLAQANHRYISTLWSAGFYAIENCLDSIRDAQTFIGNFIKQTYTILNEQSTPYFLFYQLYMGLERFLLSNMIPSGEINTIQKLLNSKFNDDQKSLCLTSLTVTSLYASNQSKQVTKSLILTFIYCLLIFFFFQDELLERYNWSKEAIGSKLIIFIAIRTNK